MAPVLLADHRVGLLLLTGRGIDPGRTVEMSGAGMVVSVLISAAMLADVWVKIIE